MQNHFYLSFTKNLLILVILWNHKNAALQDLEVWVDMEKLEANQEPRLHMSDTGLMSIVPTQTVQQLIFNNCCLDPIIRN